MFEMRSILTEIDVEFVVSRVFQQSQGFHSVKDAEAVGLFAFIHSHWLHHSTDEFNVT